MRTLRRALLISLLPLILSVCVSVSVCVEGLSDTEAVLGSPMKLTCISCMKREDIKSVTLVSWYHVLDGHRIPILKYVDSPEVLDSHLKGRLRWDGSKDLQDISISITNITRNDSGNYECVVFRKFEFEFFTHNVTTTRVIKLEVKEEASYDLTALYSEILMYVLLVFLTLWLLVEMVYCYRKISKSEEQAQDAVYLATGDSFRTIGFSYCVGTSTVCRIVREVASALWAALVEEEMAVSTREDWTTMAEQFEWRWNFPDCIGAIDGKHVVIQAPANSGSLYHNYKGTFSLVLLAVVDANYLFRIVDVGSYGRTSDSGSLRNSAFGEGLRDGTLDLPPDRAIVGAEQRGPLPHVFVGDEAFPLNTHLLRPFPGRNHPLEKRVFNYRLSRARLVVECAFGILASRWRMYRRVIATTPEVAEVCVKATCVLHNFLRRKKLQRLRRRRVEPDIEPSTDPEALCDAPRMGSNNATRRTIQMREAYCGFFSEEGAVAWQPRAESPEPWLLKPNSSFKSYPCLLK